MSSLIFWGSSTPSRSISYTDSLFLIVSAMTEAGLNTINLSQLNTFQQWLLWLHILIGSAIFVSAFVVQIRKRAFESRFKAIIKAQKEERRERLSLSRRRTHRRSASNSRYAEGPYDESAFESRHSQPRDPASEEATSAADVKSSVKGAQSPTVAARSDESSVGDSEIAGVVDEKVGDAVADRITFSEASLGPNSSRQRRNSNQNLAQGSALATSNYLVKSGASLHSHDFITSDNVGRNSQFRGLTREERESLGGVEYRAIKLFSYIVPLYFISWQIFTCIGLGAYMAHNKAEVIRDNGLNPWWLGAFNAVSAFNNSGMSLLDANMIPFQTSIYVLITMGLLILAGNTAYPIFLRLILWTMLRVLPEGERYRDLRDTLEFILRHPRRVYTNLFPSNPTWWLLFALVVLNGTDWLAFELLNMGNPAVQALPRHARVLDGLFQAVAVRSGGFYVISIPSLRIGLQILYVLMMYVSVYPVVITMRHSNVYEERSLGIYAEDVMQEKQSNPLASDETRVEKMHRRFALFRGRNPQETHYFVKQQLRGQLAHDLWWLMLSILFITTIETSNFERDPVTYSVFNVAFEVVSGYGCVGISTGIPNEAFSFCGGWHIASKLILVAVMIRGRHRGLPVAIDRAVLLPSEMAQTEEEDSQV